MYLSVVLSRLYLRKEEQGEGDNRKTDPSGRGRAKR